MLLQSIPDALEPQWRSLQKMNALGTCGECGGELGAAAPLGLCPKCLLGLGFNLEGPAAGLRPKGSERQMGDYQLIEQIGRGGMGTVYRARQMSLGREVALKMVLPAHAVRPEAIERFHIEAEAAAKLQHPNIVPIYEVGREAGECYLSMQLIEGTNLDQCAADFQLPRATEIASKAQARERQEEIARLLSTVAAAVHFAHEQGIIHRDLKPKNILIRRDGEPFLTDFGLAKILDRGESLTESAAVLGTLKYMAPEQAAGGRISRGADVFSLGAVLYELLLQAPPFQGGTPAETLRALAEQEPLDPRQVNRWIDPDLAIICLRCLQKNPCERYATAGALAEDLQRWLKHEPIQARPVSAAIRVQRWIRRNRLAAALLAALMVGLTITVVCLTMVIQQRSAAEVMFRVMRLAMSETLGQISAPQPYFQISSEGLAALRGAKPSVVSGEVIRCTLGVPALQNHLDTALRYAKLIDYLERTLAEELGNPLRIDLRLYGQITGEAVTSDGTTFVWISPMLYLKERLSGRTLQPVVRSTNWGVPCVIVVRSGTPFKSLEDLRGHSLRFGEEHSPVTFWAKVLLMQNGIRARELSRCDFIQQECPDTPMPGGYFSANSLALEEVADGKFDAAVATDHQFQQSQYKTNLVVLKSFQSMGNFWAAGSNATPAQIQAFCRAMQRLRDPPRVLTSLPEKPLAARGFIKASRPDYEAIIRDHTTVAQFDEPVGKSPPDTRSASPALKQSPSKALYEK